MRLKIAFDTPRVFDLRRCPDWKQDPNGIYIGRAGKGQSGYFGNPYRVRQDDPGSASRFFEVYARRRCGTDPDFRLAVKNFRGKNLYCFCGDEHCHGNVLVKLCREFNSKESNAA